ncbi:MAG: Teichoic-acid-transporting ATPase [Microgenomates group bacterium GW2011_GWC2_46_7]|nr:MAG: Teichoic-acid-transporting ATPase [Microgenomates group bacterium GW2011_GWC2_46_7]
MTTTSQTAIKIENVSKLFFKQEQKTFKEFLPAFFTGKKTREWFWALQDINLEIKRGESVGIMGPNGSGKSTLLKLIAGVSEPTKGTITTIGRVAPLIELGAGFHPELSGRENVYLNGVILGMSRSDVEAKFKTIINFAELWDFIDVPVKHYSTGMYLRLAFSVAIHTDPEILLIDEILAVGDEQFQAKCFAKLREFQKQHKTIIYVSHDKKSVMDFCTRVIYLNKSRQLS